MKCQNKWIREGEPRGAGTCSEYDGHHNQTSLSTSEAHSELQLAKPRTPKTSLNQHFQLYLNLTE